MNQTSYLSDLQTKLDGKLPESVIKDILADYEGFFISGREEGKTDEEIAAELGDISLLAASLIETLQERKGSASVNRTVNPGKRVLAFILDGVIAVIPAFIISIIYGSVWISFMLIIFYAAPIEGIFIYASVPAYQTFTYTETNGSPDVISTSVDGELIQMPGPLGIAFAYFGVFFYLLYAAISTLIFRGQTIGKRLMGIRIVRTDSSFLSKGPILSREILGKVIINSIPLVPFVSLLMLLLTKDNRTLHDYLAGTLVVDDREA